RTPTRRPPRPTPRASARPMPFDAPVTTTTRPAVMTSASERVPGRWRGCALHPLLAGAFEREDVTHDLGDRVGRESRPPVGRAHVAIAELVDALIVELVTGVEEESTDEATTVDEIVEE